MNLWSINPNYNMNFWRNNNGQEIDLLFEKDGKLSAFEFKWKKQQGKIPADFVKKYGNINFTIINQSNYLDFLKLDQ